MNPQILLLGIDIGDMEKKNPKKKQQQKTKKKRAKYIKIKQIKFN